MTAPASASPIAEHERQGLTVWGETFSAQIRTESGQDVLVFFVRDDAPLSVDGLPTLPPSDVAKLRALLNEAATR